MNRRPALRIIVFALAMVSVAVAPWTAFADAQGASIDKTGWWNRFNEATSTPAGPVTVPPPPGIPDGSLAVSASEPSESPEAEPTAIAAIGIQPDEGPGATVQRFELKITEDADAEGNAGTGEAVIVACPITDFWVGGENSEWETRPTHDCEAAKVAGQRNDDGVWTFDLAPIGALWFDTFGTIRADGIVLRPDLAENTAPFQAVFDIESIDVVLEAEPAPDDGDDPFTFEDPPSDAGFQSGGSSGGGGGGSLFSPPVVTSPPTTLASPQPDVPAADPGDDAGGETAAPPVVDQPANQPVVSRAGDVFGNLPFAMFLGLPLLLATLAAISYWFGPAGEPVTTVRQRGVSRALDARARSMKDH